MWGLVYLGCAVVKPDIFEGWPSIYGFIGMVSIGCLMIVGLVFGNTTKGKIVLFTMGVFESIGGIASWCGVIMWNVPFQDKAIFNVSMAFLDFLGAAALFTKSLDVYINIKKIFSSISPSKNLNKKGKIK